ncbi:MAG: succinate dehydrogenase assembly factor 2 [Pseudomonadota bacterium]|nr:succinate dehydrogenase assembly factor 2 [Pseudomonadota bacterium]
MTQEINRIKWKSRRGMRELDLLFRPIITNDIAAFNDKDLMLFDEILDYDDQSLYDFIFKNMKLQSVEHEIFLKKILKK